MRPLRRVAAVAAIGLALGTGTAALAGAGGGDGGYLVRAIFDNSSFVIPGEDVKVAGVKVGTIAAVDLTAQDKAAVVLRIDDPAFRPFRADAHCSIGLQSLIGEQFVQCTPTQPRADGTPLPPALPAIRSGPGKGEHLLPLQSTTTPVGMDLLNDIMRVPQQQRLRLIVNELGAGLAGNGTELRAAIRRAVPALQQTDRVIALLAGQDRLLARLVDESDRALAPLAAQRAHLGGFVQHAGEAGVAAAQRGDALAADLAKLPAFLRRLGPASERFGALADQMTPALDSLRAQAPAIDASVRGLGSASRAATPALVSLGRVAQRGRRTFPRIQSLAGQLGALGVPLRPLARNLALLSSSFDRTGGIEEVMRFIYFYTGAVNGEDALGHYIRSSLQVSNCSARMSAPAAGCESTFDKGAAHAAAALAYLLGP